MAIASNQVLIDRERGLKLANRGDPLDLTNQKFGKRALMNFSELEEEQNKAEERAKKLLNLVELTAHIPQ